MKKLFIIALIFLNSTLTSVAADEFRNDITSINQADAEGVPRWRSRICADEAQLEDIREIDIKYRGPNGSTSIDKSALIQMSVYGQMFEIPLGHFRTPYLPEHLDQLETKSDGTPVYRTKWDQTQSDLIIWHPDMSWPPFRTRKPIFRTCSQPGAHRLRVWIKNPFLGEELMDGDKPEYRDVWLAQRSGLFSGLGNWGLYENLGQPLLQEKHGLIEVWWEKTDENLRVQKSYGDDDIGVRRYINQASDKRRILGSCYPTSKGVVFDTCRFRVYWPQEGLGIEIDILQQHLGDWDAVFEAVRMQLNDWKMEEKRERGEK